MLELINDLAFGSSGPDFDKSNWSVEDMAMYQEQMDAMCPPCGRFFVWLSAFAAKTAGRSACFHL
jgi:hypothetical protein